MNTAIKVVCALCVGVILFSIMLGTYQQGREAGIVDGMTIGFDAGYKLKKPPIIIVRPPQQSGGVVQRVPDQDSVLWRI